MTAGDGAGDSALRRVLVVIAHPDDADFWAGGTIAAWSAQGAAVTYCVITDGEAGGFDPAVPRTLVPVIRRAEQRDAASILGAEDVVFLGYRDGYLEPSIELRKDIARVIRRVRPDRMLVWSPEWNWTRPSHPDHRAAGEAAWSAIFPDARNPFAHPDLLEQERLEPWAVGEVWMIGSPRPDHYVDIADTVDRKIAALRAYASQTGCCDRLVEQMRERLAPNAAAAGLPSGRIAEGFQVVHIG
jgi:LmbE family N-acetylglucosaminyl deacetylase